MRALLWGIIVVAVGALLYETAATTDSTVATCPSAAGLAKILDSIRTGELTAAQAEQMAQTYERARCPAATAAIRTAAKTKAAVVTAKAAIDHTVFGLVPRTPGSIDPIGDITDMTVAGLSPADGTGNLRHTVQDYIDKPGLDWTEYDRMVFVPALEKRVLADFTAQGKYREGVTPLIGVTAYNQLHAQRTVADGIALAKAGPGPGPGGVDFGSSGDYHWDGKYTVPG